MSIKNNLNELSKREKETCDHLSYEINEDLEKFLKKYEILFKKLFKEAIAIKEDDFYLDYGLSKKTESIQAMARIAYYLNTRLPDGLDMCPLLSFFMDDLVNSIDECDQRNGKDIWESLLTLGKNLDEAHTYMGFLSNDIGLAVDARKEREKKEK